MPFEINITQEQKNKWIGDLRANAGLQGKGSLYQYERFCCLGRHLMVNGFGELKAPYYTTMHLKTDGFGECHTYSLLRDQLSSTVVDILTTKNDGTISEVHNPGGETWTFSQIADWIEINLIPKKEA